MSPYRTHNDIIDLWKTLSPDASGPRHFIVLARDLERYLPIKVSYYMVYRWRERNSIPIEYHDALVAAARWRKFPGVTNAVLARIKAQELIAKASSPSREVSAA